MKVTPMEDPNVDDANNGSLEIPSKRGYSSADNHMVRNATLRNRSLRMSSSYFARIGPFPGE